MPVDFEIVKVDSTVTSEDDINNAITAIKRNGVALKGRHERVRVLVGVFGRFLPILHLPLGTVAHKRRSK